VLFTDVLAYVRLETAAKRYKVQIYFDSKSERRMREREKERKRERGGGKLSSMRRVNIKLHFVLFLYQRK